MQKSLDRSGIKDPLDKWDKETIKKMVDAFLEERFPTVIVSRVCSVSSPQCTKDLANTLTQPFFYHPCQQALNKIDLPDSDKNISRIMRKYDQV